MSETTNAALAAGREMDRLVAENVFGFEVEATPVACYSITRFPKWTRKTRLPSYSTDEKAAALVRTWIQERCRKNPDLLYCHALMYVREQYDLADCSTGEWFIMEANLPLTWCRIALAIALALAEQDGAK